MPEITFDPREVNIPSNQKQAVAQNISNLNQAFYQTPVSQGVGEYFPSDSVYDRDIQQTDIFDINKYRAERQPWYAQIGASLGTVANEAILGTVQGLAALGDLPSYEALLNNSATSDEDFHNAVYDWAKNLKETINEEIPIYSGDRFDSGWFWKNLGQTIGSAASFYVPGMGAAKLLGRLGEAVKLGTTASKTLQTLGGAAVMRHAENFQEASSMFDSTYQNTVDFLTKKNAELPVEQQLSQEDIHNKAIDLAGEAAASDYKMNAANYIFDVMQMGAILKPKFASKVLGTAERQPYAVLKAANLLPESKIGKLAKWATDPAKGILEAGSEGLEEIVNTVSQFEAERDAKIKSGELKDDGSDFMSRLGNYLGNEELQDSFIWGMVGGAAFKGLALATGTDESKQDVRNKLEELSTRPETIRNYGEEVNKVVNDTTIPDKKKTELLNQLDESLAFDLGISSRKAGTTEILLQQLDQPEFQKQFVDTGVTSQEELSTKIPQLKKKIEQAAYTYDKYFNKFYESPIRQTAKNMLIEDGIQYEKELHSNLENLDKLKVSESNIITKDPQVRLNITNPEYVATAQSVAYDLAKKELADRIKNEPDEDKQRDLTKVYDILEKNSKLIDKSLVVSKFRKNPLSENLAQQYLTNGFNDVLNANIEKLADTKLHKQVDEVAKVREDKAKQFVKENKAKATANAKKDRVKETIEKTKSPEELAQEMEMEAQQEVVEPVQQDEVFIDNEQAEPVNISEEGKVVDPLTTAKEQLANERDIALQQFPQDAEAINTKYEQDVKAVEEAFFQDTKTKEEVSTEKTTGKVELDQNQYDYDKYKEVVTVDEQTEQGISEANADKEVDASGNITYEYNRSRFGHNIAAYLQRLFKQTWDGNVLKRQDIDDNLNPEFNKEILDYNKYNTGTKVTIEIADDDTIPVYIPGTKEQTTWGTLKKTVDFNENVPLVIKDKDGNKLFYLHSLDWINVDNVFGDITKDKENLRKIRQHIITLSKKNEVYETSIIERRNGTLFRTKNKQLVNLSEAMPDPNLIIGVGYDKSGNIKIGDNKFQEGEVHVKYTQPGVTYAIVNLNKDFTTAIPVYNEKIADSNIKNKVIDSISAAITVYLKQKELTPQLQQVADTIKEANGIDVTTIEGLEEYMKQFINLYNTGKASLKDLMKEPTFNNGKRHLITIKNKSIEFTSKGSAAYNIQNNEYFDTNLKSLKETLGNMYFQVNINNIDSNKNVTYFNLTPEGVANTESISYKDFVKQHTKTNVLSFEVSPGVWNYTVQPKFTLDFSKILTEEETPEVVETVEPVSPVEPVTPVEVKPTETISAEEKAIRDRWDAATQDIISRYGLEGVKTGEGKETLDESDSQYKAELKALKGIKPKRQYKKTNFDYNSYSPATITPLEESARKYIIRELGFNKQEQLTNFLTREVVKELVKSKAEVIPSQIYAKFATKFNTDLADIEENISIATEEGDQENLAKFEAIKQMIEPIVSNWSLIEKFASYKLARINNIKFDFNDDVDLEMDGYEESERNNWDQHSATVDPKASMSKDMKLFMSDINRKTAEGEIKKTFFGLPDVMDYNEVYNNLQAVTANLKPNLDVLIAAIESNAVVQPWMQDVADKLRKGTRLERNLFVRTMTNHSRQMYSMMYGIDDNGDFSFKIIDSNATSKPKIIREKWLYVAEANKELTKLNEAGEYIFNIGEGTPKTKFVQRFNELEAKPELRTTQNIIDWLAIIGIEINALTANDLRDKKTRGLSFAQQFTDAKGLFLNLKKMVEKYGEASIESDSGLYESTVVQDLSNLEAKYNMQVHSNSFRSGNKQVYSYGKNNYAVNRVRDLKSDKNLLNNLAELPFSKHSTWLQGLQTGTLASNFDISVISLEALNQFGSKQRDNRELHNLTPAEIERAKVGFIQASQRDFSMGKVNKRVITLLYPTTSDKTTPYIIRTEAVDIAMDSKGNITDKFIDDVLYKQLVLPEIERIRNFEKLKATGKLDTLNHAEYEVAGFKFMLLPEINTIPGVFDEAGNLHPDIHTNEDIQKAIRNKIREYVESIVAYKLQNWKKYGIGEFIKDANGKDTAKLNYIDNKYITEKLKNIDKPSRVNAAATDMVVQYLVGNANVFMTIIGDPAQFYKSKSTDPIVQVEDTFINIGKRLAGDIAPRDESVASDTNNYIQAIVANKSSNSILAEELLKLIDGANVTMAEFKAYSKAEKKAFMDKYKAAKYYEFDGTDAQEITTLLERLYMMESYGAVNGQSLPNGFYDIVAPVIKREIANNNHYYDEAVIEELNKVNSEWVDVYKNLVFQPTKPVYQQNIVDLQLGVERRVYIKSSDYPLVPSATKGFEIDKLRIQMEKAGIARLAFKTAVKVGSVKNTVKIFNEDGTIVDNIDWTNSTLNLPRSGFGYQQEVPYDEMKKAINRVSQASKNLFNNILSVKDFDYKGRKVDGFELQKIYHGLYDKLFKLQKEEFEKTVKNEDGSFNIPKLKKLLKEEIQKRDYPISDSDALDLDELLTFMAYSPAADKYESLLNSLVQNRIIKTEFAGKSFVVASEEGWQLQKGKSLKDSGIIFTPKFEGYLKPNQVIIPFKQRDNEGKLLHLEDFVDPETGLLDTYKLPEELLRMLVMRIPNQGLNSQRYVEVVGFLPHSSGDTIICSRDLVVQMGQDFDVDKLYTYMYNTYLSKDGKLSKETKDTKKVLQNEILDIHLAVHNNQDERVQKQIVEPLGFWKLPEFAEFVKAARKKRFQNNTKFTGLSDEYQKEMFITGTQGKSGTGQFSIDSTFHAISQGKNLLLTSEGKPVEMIIGNQHFKGDLSAVYSLETKEKLLDAIYKKTGMSRKDIEEKGYTYLLDFNPYVYLSGEAITYISDIILGRQSASVDNAKEQLLAALNINNNTFRAIKFFDKAGFTITDYILTQDIIFDYVEELNRLRSEGYTPNIESVAADNVKKKYVSDIKVESKDLTEAKLKDMIEQGNTSENYNAYQKLVLSLFLEADAYGQKIQTVQSAINTDSKGLDKNLFGTIVKEEQVSRLKTSGIQNAESLLGEFYKNGRLVKPTTLSGQAIYYGLYTNNELWNRFFPYQQTYLDRMLGRAEQLFGSEEKSTGKRADFRRKVWNSFKSYLYSNINFGLTEDVDAARERLFKGDNNIGKRLQELQEKDEYANHPLLSRIVVQPGEPVILKFNAVSKENSSDVNIYVGFIDLLQQEETKEFAKDLVVAAYLSGGIQEAIQYIKYIPVSYLHELPFSDNLAKTVEERLFDRNQYINLDDTPNVPHYILPNFLVQYAQHNAGNIPNKITDISKQIKTEAKINKLEDVNSFMLTDPSLYILKGFNKVPPEFLTIYDRGRKKGTNKNHLYQFTGEYKLVGENSYPVYYKLDNLGTFGYSEYNSNLVNGVNQKSSIGVKTEVKKTPQMQQPQTPVNNTAKVENKQTETFNIKAGGKKELVDALQQITLNSNDPYFKMVAQELVDNSDRIPELKLELDPKNAAFRGHWNGKNKMRLDKVNSKLELEETLLHETLHSVGDRHIELFLHNKKELIKEKNPVLLRALESLNSQMEEYTKKMWKEDPKGFREYKRKWYAIKEALDKGQVPKEELTLEESEKFYPTENLKEWFTAGASNPGFQKRLNNMSKDNTGRTWWSDFIDRVIELYKALGFNVNKNSVLATAIDDILFIAKQEPIVEETNENIEGEVIESFSPMTLREYTRMINGNYIYKNNDYTYEIYKNGSQYSLFVSKEGFNKSFPYFKVDLGDNIKNISPEEYANSNLRQLERISNYIDMNLKKELIENVFQALNSVGINNLTFNIEQTVENERLNSLLFTSLKNKYSKEKYEVELKNLNLTPTNREYFEKTKELFKTISSITETIPNINLELSNNNVILSLEEISYSPMTNIPSANEILKQAGELNSDGTKKKLAVTDDNYKVMIKRAQKVNFMQPYYKATVKETFGEGVGYKSKKFFYIDMELRNFDNFAERVKLISEQEVQQRIKYCKGR